jgi:mRNA-degrading endonuclease YafQ of YafQ-DinJ toxin-antitoxin module
MLVEHWTKGGKLSGKDRESGGAYAGKNMRHFHVSEPDLLLHYQLTKETLVLLAIGHTSIFLVRTNRHSWIPLRMISMSL